MLRNIDPRVTPELLYALACMGHGDEIVIVDTNFPARSICGTGERRFYGCFSFRSGVLPPS